MEIRCDECNKLMRMHGAREYKDKLLCFTCYQKHIIKMPLINLFVTNK